MKTNKRKQELSKLVLRDEDFIVYGNLTILGDIIIENCNLIVSGTLKISKKCNNISIINSNISVESLLISDSSRKVCIKNGDIFVASDLNSSAPIEINGDIFVCKNFSSEKELICDNLTVGGHIIANDITAKLDICTNGEIVAYNISARDIYSKDVINSYGISARDIYTEKSINLNFRSLTAYGQIYAPDGICDCSSLIVGK